MRCSLLSALCVAAVTVTAACGGGKAEVDEDFSDLVGLDEKSDAFSYRMKLLGSLDYGQTSDEVQYKNPPRFRAFKFGGHAGDQVDVWVRSTNNGDAVAWLLDDSYKVITHNDDAPEGGLDAHMTATLPANSDPSIITYYIVFRDYDLHNKKFTVELQGKPTTDFFSCQTDADCIAVPAHVCCPNCRNAAVNKDMAEAYASQPLTCSGICPLLACFLDTRVPVCNSSTQQCELVAPDCRTTGCAAGQSCQICWANWSCVPDGAVC